MIKGRPPTFMIVVTIAALSINKCNQRENPSAVENDDEVQNVQDEQHRCLVPVHLTVPDYDHQNAHVHHINDDVTCHRFPLNCNWLKILSVIVY